MDEVAYQVPDENGGQESEDKNGDGDSQR